MTSLILAAFSLDVLNVLLNRTKLCRDLRFNLLFLFGFTDLLMLSQRFLTLVAFRTHFTYKDLGSEFGSLLLYLGVTSHVSCPLVFCCE